MVRADDPPPAGLTAVSFREQGFWVHTVDPKNEDLRLFWKDDQGRLFGDFNTLEKFLGGKGEHLSFAANAGMFQPDYKSVGLLVQNGAETTTLNLNDGTGNFYMKPNGVFLVNEKHEAMVVESSSYTALLTPAVWATQSGPLLVQRGDPNPDFNAGSANKKIRSGVGVRKDGTIVFALSRVPVNFYDFASLFVDRLKCSNALYLDGEISAFYVPGTKDPVAHSFGPMVGVVKPDVSTPATNSLNTTNAPAVPPPKGP
jgi:uncharacterized protein YigE (DUF2233 family)